MSAAHKFLIDTARTHSMGSRVYETVERPSVCLSRRSTAAHTHAAGLLLSAPRAGSNLYRSITGATLSSNSAASANAGSVVLTAEERG